MFERRGEGLTEIVIQKCVNKPGGKEQDCQAVTWREVWGEEMAFLFQVGEITAFLYADGNEQSEKFMTRGETVHFQLFLRLVARG